MFAACWPSRGRAACRSTLVDASPSAHQWTRWSHNPQAWPGVPHKRLHGASTLPHPRKLVNHRYPPVTRTRPHAPAACTSYAYASRRPLAPPPQRAPPRPTHTDTRTHPQAHILSCHMLCYPCNAYRYAHKAMHPNTHGWCVRTYLLLVPLVQRRALELVGGRHEVVLHREGLRGQVHRLDLGVLRVCGLREQAERGLGCVLGTAPRYREGLHLVTIDEEAKKAGLQRTTKRAVRRIVGCGYFRGRRLV